MKKQTFSEQVKKEICSLNFEEHCLKALLSSFMSNRLTMVIRSSQYNWRLTSQFGFIIQFIERTIRSLYDVKTTVKLIDTTSNLSGETNYIEIIGNFDQMELDLCLNNKGDQSTLLNQQCCQRAFVAGAFLTGGSINSLDSKSYHLEIRSGNYKYLLLLQTILANYKICPVLTKHSKKQFILYLKKVDQISDFLKFIEAGNCMFAFEKNRIDKDMNMAITRWSNLDTSNLNKSTQSGVNQVNKIKKLMKLPIWQKQTNKFKSFCNLRLKHPSSSLNDLVVLMKTKENIKITKSGLNHLVRKLSQLTKE